MVWYDSVCVWCSDMVCMQRAVISCDVMISHVMMCAVMLCSGLVCDDGILGTASL